MTELEDKIKDIEALIEVQKTPGNFDYNPYMFGILIGLECSLATLKGIEAVYTDTPDKFIDGK